ncbi:threonine aldolase family protein [Lysobacter cavernae]|uniref:Threonine aldolase family protein n=1 Tax=Lysobacter cavernae TaxID=1685901 RepID=A0ABV7RLN7_9GAMM
MDRRQFLASSGWAAATPLLAQSIATGTRADAAPGLFEHVDFVSDGLGLRPLEYASLLHETTAARTFEADNYSNGGLITQLEQKFAQLLGKDAAMFVPTGTLANHLAIRKLAGLDRRVLVQAESHYYNDSGDCAATLSGLNLIPLASGRSTIELAEVKRWVERSAGGRVETQVGAIAIESPVRRKDHEMVDFGELQRVCHYAREQGIRLHLDGARMFNLPLHSGKSVREHAALFDTVFVSLWKHFNGACGAILAGDAGFIEGLFHMRRMFGGSLPQAWPGAAVALQYADRYEDDYAKAWRATDQLTALLQADGRFRVEKIAHGTSRFLLTVSGVAPEVLNERLGRQGIVLPYARPGTGTFPMQVNPTILRTPPEALAQAFISAMNG